MVGQDEHHHPHMALIKGKRTKRPRPAASGDSTTTTEEEEDMAHCLILLAQGASKSPKPSPEYECKTCRRSFPSFQALGGHRASHRRPASEVQDSSPSPPEKQDLGLSLQLPCNSSNTLSATNNQVAAGEKKVHACGICAAEFSSGQALGGHMRRHRPINNSGGGSIAPAPARNLLCLDLNLPAEEEDDQQQKQSESSKFMFQSEKTLVFAASLVDCRY